MIDTDQILFEHNQGLYRGKQLENMRQEALERLLAIVNKNRVITTEVTTTKHTIPYTGGELPLFTSL